MQTKQTAKLARKIRRLRERKRPLKWRAVCEKLNIRTQDGRIDPGLAYRIGYQDYEPSDRALRGRLGLKDICSKCKRTFRAVRSPVIRTKSPARAWWEKLNREDREKLIELSYQNFLDWKQRR